MHDSTIWLAQFPRLEALTATARARLGRDAVRVSLPAGARAFGVGAACEHYLLLASGRVRVQMLAESGREIVLYRVTGGETCVLTTSCLISGEAYAAEAIAETESVAFLLPRAVFNELMSAEPAFRDFVLRSWAARLADLLLLVEEVAFRRVDARLAHCLLERADAAGVVSLTHQELAVELGTAREVVSRQVKEFERRGWVQAERGAVHLLERDALRSLAAERGR